MGAKTAMDEMIAYALKRSKKYRGKKVKIDHDLIAHGVSRKKK